MRNPRITVAVLAVAAAATVGGVTIAAADSSAPNHTTSAMSATASAGTRDPLPNAATVTATTASVQGTTETILADANGLPLYVYMLDTPTASRVSGQLAALWPPLVAGSPTARGASGTLTSVATAQGEHVTYNGHFLYTFTEDRPGRVTGQGVQNFFVATPALSAGASTGTKPAQATNGYGY